MLSLTHFLIKAMGFSSLTASIKQKLWVWGELYSFFYFGQMMNMQI